MPPVPLNKQDISPVSIPQAGRVPLVNYQSRPIHLWEPNNSDMQVLGVVDVAPKLQTPFMVVPKERQIGR